MSQGGGATLLLSLLQRAGGGAPGRGGPRGPGFSGPPLEEEPGWGGRDSEEEEHAGSAGRDGASGRGGGAPRQEEEAESPVLIPRWRPALPPRPPGGAGPPFEPDGSSEEQLLPLDQVPKWERRRALPPSVLARDPAALRGEKGGGGLATAQVAGAEAEGGGVAGGDSSLSRYTVDPARDSTDAQAPTGGLPNAPGDGPPRDGSETPRPDPVKDKGTAPCPADGPFRAAAHGDPQTPQGRVERDGEGGARSAGVLDGRGRDASAGHLLSQASSSSSSSPVAKRKKTKGPTDGKMKKLAQKIMERWKESRGGPGKRGNGGSLKEDRETEEERETGKRETGGPIGEDSDRDTPDEQEAEGVCQTSINFQQSQAPPTQAEEVTGGKLNRTLSDFELSLGPINLLEDIFIQEGWSNFLPDGKCPTHAEAADQSETEVDGQTKHCQNNGQSEKVHVDLNLSEEREQNGSQSEISVMKYSQCDGRGGEPNSSMQENGLGSASQGALSPASTPTATKPDLLKPQSDEINNVQGSHLVEEEDQSQGSKPEAPPIDFSRIKSEGPLDSSALLNRAHLGRRREHRPWDRRRERGRGGEGVGYWMFRDSTDSSLSLTVEATEKQDAAEDRRETGRKREGRWSNIYKTHRFAVLKAAPISLASSLSRSSLSRSSAHSADGRKTAASIVHGHSPSSPSPAGPGC